MPSTPSAAIRPFRWNVARRAELGALPDGPLPDLYPAFLTDLRRASALTLARSAPGALVFVGRSPEPMFHYMSGLLSEVSMAPDLKLLQISIRGRQTFAELAASSPRDVEPLLGYLAEEGLSPDAITSAGKPLTFVDIVDTGGTFGGLVELLRYLCARRRSDWPAVARNIGFLGLVVEGPTSPKTWRWWQHTSWLKDGPRIRVSNVSIPGRLWGTLGNTDEKSMRSHPYWLWADPRASEPPREEVHLRGLRLALSLYDLGSTRLERMLFTRQVAGLQEMRLAHIRRLVTALRRSGGR